MLGLRPLSGAVLSGDQGLVYTPPSAYSVIFNFTTAYTPPSAYSLLINFSSSANAAVTTASSSGGVIFFIGL